MQHNRSCKDRSATKGTGTQKSLKEHTLQATTLPPKFRKLPGYPSSPTYTPAIFPGPPYSIHNSQATPPLQSSYPCPKSKNILSYRHRKTIPCHPYRPMK